MSSHVLKMIPLAFSLLFLAFLGLEHVFPLRKPTHSLKKRLFINIAFSAMMLSVAIFVVKPIALLALGWTTERSFGLIPLINAPYYIKAVICFLLLDLSFYYWHRLNHRFSLFWRFHNAHHIDPDLDVSTSYRFHFVEVLYSASFRIIQIAIIGASPEVYLIYELVFQCATLFHHSNIHLPIRIERIINIVFVTPRMHGIHHSAMREETDANYSVIFRWWDDLHRTINLGVSQTDIAIGVPAYLEVKDNTLWSIIAMPFTAQKDYWLSQEGKHLTHRAGKKPFASPRVLAE